MYESFLKFSYLYLKYISNVLKEGIYCLNKYIFIVDLGYLVFFDFMLLVEKCYLNCWLFIFLNFWYK